MDYILSMYSRNMEGALEKTDNDLEDILLSNSTLMLLKNKSGLQRWHASYALSELLNKKLSSTMEADAYVVLMQNTKNLLWPGAIIFFMMIWNPFKIICPVLPD